MNFCASSKWVLRLDVVENLVMVFDSVQLSSNANISAPSTPSYLGLGLTYPGGLVLSLLAVPGRVPLRRNGEAQ